MRERLLRFQLVTLLAITLLSVLFFVFSDTLPDHQYSISSNNQGIGFISYHLTSLISSIHYYFGVWTILSLVPFALLYSFNLNKKSSYLDVLYIIPILLLAFVASYFFLPFLIGDGLKYYADNIFGDTTLIWIAVVVSPIMLYLVFGSQLKGLFKLSIKLGKVLFSKLGTVKRKAIETKELIPEIKLPEISKPAILEKIQPKKEEFVNDENAEQVSLFEEESGETKEKIIRKKAIKDSSFKSKDLIKTLSIDSSKKKNIKINESYFSGIVEAIQDKLFEFNIQGKIINILKGPVVDTFELELGKGVKVSKVNSITEDLSLALCGVPIRLVYPLTGKTTMGIEVPRDPREIIYLDEVLESKEFSGSSKRLPICMGKDAYGVPSVVDLCSMPHMLIAGATGAGKSVFINTLLVSLLVKKSPEDMKLILIDPKQLELALYANLPHLLLPVMTDASSASLSLLWACQEMERRYSILKDMAVRNIAAYNERIEEGKEEKLKKIEKYFDDRSNLKLPYIVIIIDEFADLILTKSGKEIENNICRLAAKARACGIHLVLATQRPSVDVITGLIKANFPTRVSFKVTSGIDSRTILSDQGAEKLLGMGDMLYKHGIEMKRLHSAYIDEAEIECLVEKLDQLPKSIDENAVSFIESEGEDSGGGVYDYSVEIEPSSEGGGGVDEALMKKAIGVIMEHKKASASFLQRRLSIGYNKAANLIEKMEERGIVGPAQGSKPREILFKGHDSQ